MRKKKTKEIKIERSSGNIFEDLEVPNPEEYLVKAELAHEISQLIKKKDLNQKEAAEILAIDQPKISALSRGRLSGFSVERLLKYLTLLNQDIEIVIRPRLYLRGQKFSEEQRHICVRYAAS